MRTESSHSFNLHCGAGAAVLPVTPRRSRGEAVPATPFVAFTLSLTCDDTKNLDGAMRWTFRGAA